LRAAEDNFKLAYQGKKQLNLGFGKQKHGVAEFAV